MSGGLPRLDIGAGDSRSKRSATTTPVPDEATRAQNVVAERLRAARATASSQPLAAPDIADVALRDASSGKVRKVRAGSTRDSILGSAMQLAALLGASMLAWLASRGE